MLNNRGWGLQAMMICILVLMFALIIVSVLANRLNKTLNSEYVALENKAVEVAIKYVDDNNIELKSITIKELIENRYLTDFSDDNGKKCSGYIKNSLNYKAYIKCDNYTTAGYSEKYDEI